MLNRNPSNTSNVISSYRKRRQQRGPFLVYGAIVLVVIGFIVIVYWLLSSRSGGGGLFPTDTPTPTLTFTPSNTLTPSITATITLTPTETLTPTPSGPTQYTILEGDVLQTIAEKFNLGKDGVLLILEANPSIINDYNGVIFPGQTITIPAPGTILPTTTPIPANLSSGTRIEYKVLPGDTLAGIASRFNSKEENIITVNKIEDANALQVGQVLQIPVNLVTATATLPSTSTPVSPTVAGQSTPAPGSGSSTSCTVTENTTFVSEMQLLINNARTSNSLTPLNSNQKLTSAAKAHATDMLCNNYLSHIGLDSSTPQSRVAAQGYTASLVLEDIYALSPVYGGNPQSAFNWWMNDPSHRADILNQNTTEFGIAYVSSEKSLLGGYFVVVSAKP